MNRLPARRHWTSQTASLALRLARKHVRTKAIAPGRFCSNMTHYVSKDFEAIRKQFDVIALPTAEGEGQGLRS